MRGIRRGGLFETFSFYNAASPTIRRSSPPTKARLPPTKAAAPAPAKRRCVAALGAHGTRHDTTALKRRQPHQPRPRQGPERRARPRGGRPSTSPDDDWSARCARVAAVAERRRQPSRADHHALCSRPARPRRRAPPRGRSPWRMRASTSRRTPAARGRPRPGARSTVEDDQGRRHGVAAAPAFAHDDWPSSLQHRQHGRRRRPQAQPTAPA